jgi:hypothetical protein
MIPSWPLLLKKQKGHGSLIKEAAHTRRLFSMQKTTQANASVVFADDVHVLSRHLRLHKAVTTNLCPGVATTQHVVPSFLAIAC